MSFAKTIKLNDGNEIPQIGLGTWLSKPGEVKAAVIHAVKSGYRHLDLARVYQNQEEIGEALKEVIPSVVKREDLFITSKLWNNAHQPHLVEKALDETLQQLGLEYLDLYLIHWPVSLDSGDDIKNLFPSKDGVAILDSKTSLVDTWKAVIELQKKGKAKSIGVSNFAEAHIEGIVKATGVTPAVNQIEGHPLLPQENLVQYSKLKNIHLTAYSPLGNPGGYPGKKVDVISHPKVKEIADKLNVTAGQVLIAWGVKRGQSVIPKSVTPARIEKNFEQVELSDDDFKSVSSLLQENGAHVRFNIPVDYEPSWPINVFGEQREDEAAANHVNIGA